MDSIGFIFIIHLLIIYYHCKNISVLYFLIICTNLGEDNLVAEVRRDEIDKQERKIRRSKIFKEKNMEKKGTNMKDTLLDNLMDDTSRSMMIPFDIGKSRFII
jgi:hypothetical protein